MSDYGIYPILAHTFFFPQENWAENGLCSAIGHETKTVFEAFVCFTA